MLPKHFNSTILCVLLMIIGSIFLVANGSEYQLSSIRSTSSISANAFVIRWPSSHAKNARPIDHSIWRIATVIHKDIFSFYQSNRTKNDENMKNQLLCAINQNLLNYSHFKQCESNAQWANTPQQYSNCHGLKDFHEIFHESVENKRNQNYLIWNKSQSWFPN